LAFFAFLKKIETSIIYFFILSIQSTMDSFLTLVQTKDVIQTLNGYPEFNQTGLKGWMVAGATREEWDSDEVLRNVKDFLIKKESDIWTKVFSP